MYSPPLWVAGRCPTTTRTGARGAGAGAASCAPAPTAPALGGFAPALPPGGPAHARAAPSSTLPMAPCHHCRSIVPPPGSAPHSPEHWLVPGYAPSRRPCQEPARTMAERAAEGTVARPGRPWPAAAHLGVERRDPRRAAVAPTDLHGEGDERELAALELVEPDQVFDQRDARTQQHLVAGIRRGGVHREVQAERG